MMYSKKTIFSNLLFLTKTLFKYMLYIHLFKSVILPLWRKLGETTKKQLYK